MCINCTIRTSTVKTLIEVFHPYLFLLRGNTSSQNSCRKGSNNLCSGQLHDCFLDITRNDLLLSWHCSTLNRLCWCFHGRWECYWERLGQPYFVRTSLAFSPCCISVTPTGLEYGSCHASVSMQHWHSVCIEQGHKTARFKGLDTNFISAYFIYFYVYFICFLGILRNTFCI